MGYIIGYNTLCDEIELDLQKYSEFIIKNIASVESTNNEFQIAGDDRSIIAKTVIFTDDSCLEDFNIEVLKIYCKIKEIDFDGSDRHIRSRVWKNIESEFEMDLKMICKKFGHKNVA
jgi:hypothetical protein